MAAAEDVIVAEEERGVVIEVEVEAVSSAGGTLFGEHSALLKKQLR